MANTLYLLTTTDEVTSDSEVLNETMQETTASYTEVSKGVITIATGAGYTALPFGGVSSATYVRISSTTALSVKINAGSEILAGVTDYICAGTFTAISVSQSSGSSCDVSYEFYG
jgi:hypothetical protein